MGEQTPEDWMCCAKRPGRRLAARDFDRHVAGLQVWVRRRLSLTDGRDTAALPSLRDLPDEQEAGTFLSPKCRKLLERLKTHRQIELARSGVVPVGMGL